MQEGAEIFKDIPNYEGWYKVSNLGNVKSVARKTIQKNSPRRKVLRFEK